MVIMQSCGCVPKEKKQTYDFMNDNYNYENDSKGFDVDIHYMNTDFAAVTEAQALFDKSDSFAKLFKLKRMYICLCSNIVKETSELNKEDIIASFRGIGDTMVNMFSFGSEVPVGRNFPSAELVPEDILNGEKPVTFAFSPMYFKDSFLGYIAYEPSGFKGYGNLFATWLMILSNNTGCFFMNQKLELVVKQLEDLYVRDPLTGLFNRRGMSKFGIKLLEKAKKRIHA